MKKDLELQPSDVVDKDLLISLGKLLRRIILDIHPKVLLGQAFFGLAKVLLDFQDFLIFHRR